MFYNFSKACFSVINPKNIKLNMSQIIEIDGSTLEGGGQILRVSLTISALRKQPVRIVNIRAGRSKPGLMEQHLKGLELVRDICDARVEGGVLGSTKVEFYPNDIKGGNFKSNCRTAGSISLLLQVVLPCTYFSNTSTTLTLQGGTNCEMAPQIDYTTEVFRPIMEKFGATFDFTLNKRGYFPKGGGEVVIKIEPVKQLKPVEITERGRITSIYGWSFVAGTLPERLAHETAEAASRMLREYSQVNIESYKEDREVAPFNCSGIILVAETDTKCLIGASALYQRNERSGPGERAAEELIKYLEEGCCIDAHSQDQIVIFMALAKGRSKVRVGEITLHTKTAIFVVEKLMPNVKFEVIVDGKTNIIQCTGS